MNATINQNWQLMRKWLSQPVGKYYLDAVHLKMKAIISKSFGYHLLIIGEPGLANCVADSPIKHHILIHHCEDSQRNIYSLCCSREDKLPIETESVDIIYLAHCLELYSNPHEILREAYRVLRPEGRIIISGFNPWSMFGVWYVIGRILKIFPWRARLLSAFKLKDWLQLLGFSHLQKHNLFYYFPTNRENVLQKLQLLEKLISAFKLFFGAAYLIMAYKRVITLTPIVPKWEVKRYLVTEELAETVPQKYSIVD